MATDYKRILVRRGDGDLPPDLQEGELAFQTNTDTLFIGNGEGAVELAKQTTLNALDASLSEDIATNAAAIVTNTTAIANNATAIGTNAAGIVTNASGIATNTANIATNTANIATNTANIATNTAAIGNKQDTLLSGTNIKTVNGNSIVGSGDIEITAPSGTPSRTFLGSVSAYDNNETKVLTLATMRDYTMLYFVFYYYDDSESEAYKQTQIIYTEDFNTTQNLGISDTDFIYFRTHKTADAIIQVKPINVTNQGISVQFGNSIGADDAQTIEVYGLS